MMLGIFVLAGLAVVILSCVAYLLFGPSFYDGDETCVVAGYNRQRAKRGHYGATDTYRRCQMHRKAHQR